MIRMQMPERWLFGTSCPTFWAFLGKPLAPAGPGVARARHGSSRTSLMPGPVVGMSLFHLAPLHGGLWRAG